MGSKPTGAEAGGVISAEGTDGATAIATNTEMQQLWPSGLSWPLDGMELQWPDSIICI